MNYYIMYGAAFVLGGNAYCLVEMLYRKRTHYSMFFCAGFAVVLMLALYVSHRSINPLLFAVISGGIITALELVFGIVFNLVLKESVWDYSHAPLNFLGQICLPFSGIWILFGLIIYFVFKLIKL